jgi:hypothetical protein
MSSAPWGIRQRFFYDSLIRVAEPNRRGQDYGMRRRPQIGVGRIDLDPGGAEIQRGLVAWRLCETRLDVGAVSIMPPERISLSRVWSSG